MSQDIVDGFLSRTEWTSFRWALRPPGSLVVLARVERQRADQLAVVRENADIESGNEDDDADAVMIPADPDVVELGFVAEGDHPRGVDDVVADTRVVRHGDLGSDRPCFVA